MSKLLHNFEDQSKSTISADFAIEQDGNRYIPKSLLVTLDATHAGYKNKNFFYYANKKVAFHQLCPLQKKYYFLWDHG